MRDNLEPVCPANSREWERQCRKEDLWLIDRRDHWFFFPRSHPRGRRLSDYSRFPHRRDSRSQPSRQPSQSRVSARLGAKPLLKAMIIFAFGDPELSHPVRVRRDLRVGESRGNANAKCRERKSVRVLLTRPYLPTSPVYRYEGVERRKDPLRMGKLITK